MANPKLVTDDDMRTGQFSIS